MEEYIKTNRELWQKLTGVNATSAYYRLAQFKQGENALHELEMGEVGSVDGKSLLHLQCHFGMDTLSWARLGAEATGVDFSPKAIDLARSLSEELKIPAKFICCDLYDLPAQLQGQFDVVFTSYGVLTWLADITRWARLAASYLKPGGVFYIVEFHPFAQVFSDTDTEYWIKYPYFHNAPFIGEVDASYTGDEIKFAPNETFEWNHPLGEVVSALIEAGLQIEFLHEFPYSVYQQLPNLYETNDRKFVFHEKEPLFPLMYSIKATKAF